MTLNRKRTDMNAKTIQWIIATVLLLACLGCAQPKYVHAVFFTCKDGTPDAEIDALIADGNDLLGRIPTVRRVDTGRRDPEATREVNVTDYHVGLVVYFDDRAGHDVYADHPNHLEYVAKHKDHWAKVRVLDFIAE
jgi:hypothetical protein